MTSQDGIKSARRVVVKVGTRRLVDGDRNLDRASIQQLVDDLVAVREQGRLVVLVSSGAIGAGLRPLGLARRPTSIPELQACAAVGQARLMQAYEEAISHINTYGSSHTDAIVTRDPSAADRFLRQVDSAGVMVNGSTRMADGGEYGLGAEIGISTDKLHARGPMGAEELTTLKWVVVGEGQLRS